MKPRISMVTLGVRDLEASINFYEKGLGFPRLESEPGVAFFTLNGTWLGLYGREALAEDATVSPEGKGFRAFSLAHNVASEELSLIHISEPTRQYCQSRMPSSA